MLQEATRAINSAFNNSFIKKLPSKNKFKSNRINIKTGSKINSLYNVKQVEK